MSELNNPWTRNPVPSEVIVRLLLVHPSSLMYSEIFLRLEPLGLERVAGAAREAGHDVRVIDLQVSSRADLMAEMASFQPRAIGISLNYPANVPEAIEISAAARQAVPGCFVFLGGHSVSFIAEDVLEQAAGHVDAIVRGEGETARPGPDALSPPLLHRRARSLRVGRVHRSAASGPRPE
jgi:hopanoid C-3 methylase